MGGKTCVHPTVWPHGLLPLCFSSHGWTFLLGTLLHDHTGCHCADHAFFGPFSWSPEREKQPGASTLTLWWLKFGPTGALEGGGGGYPHYA